MNQITSTDRAAQYKATREYIAELQAEKVEILETAADRTEQETEEALELLDSEIISLYEELDAMEG